MILSFVVIAYNEARNIEATLQSIFAQQLLSSFEVVVVNDGSTDSTLQVMQQVAADHPELHIINFPHNKGRGAGRSAGVNAAKGDYLAFVDADIVLPSDWWVCAKKHIGDYDACGGTAVPDGDVAFVYRVFHLLPKVAQHSTTVTGSNGLFRRSVFSKVGYNSKKKNGEDVALVHAMNAAGLTSFTIPGLLVEHHETKTYAESLGWLFESGQGASRQFYEHTQIRLPDIAFFIFITLSALAAFASWVFAAQIALPLWFGVAIYVAGTSVFHLHTKFFLQKTPLRSLGAIGVNMTLLVAYYLGRLYGLAVEWRGLRT